MIYNQRGNVLQTYVPIQIQTGNNTNVHQKTISGNSKQLATIFQQQNSLF